VPRPRVPFQVDLRAVRRAHDLDASFDELRPNVALVRERRSNFQLAALIRTVVEPLALFRLEVLERRFHRFELRRIAADHDALLAHDHRLAGRDTKRRTILRRLGPLQLARCFGMVVTERFQRLADLLVGLLEQPADLNRRDVAVFVLGQLDAGPDRLRHVAFDTFDDHSNPLGAQRCGEHQTQNCGQECPHR
jgi:hypothetical protein